MIRRFAGFALITAAVTLSPLAPLAQQPTSPAPPPPSAQAPPAAPAPSPAPAEVQKEFLDAARHAWTFIDAQYRPSTGLVGAVREYQWATIWDLGSGLAALYTARELGLLEPAEYEKRMGKVLATLLKVGIYDQGAYNKTYHVGDGAMADRQEKPSARGFGWSTTDLGRLLIWLKIVATRHPQFAEAATAAAQRVDFKRLVRNGYLYGEDLGPTLKVRKYIEGQIGYEQYAAQGFALWGARAEKALDFDVNAKPLEVMGQQLIADKRQQDRLTSEPFVLMGLETGWNPRARTLATALLAAQQERARRTGHITIVSEDAISRPPYYFYYYNVFGKGKQFSIDVQDPRANLDEPRWISTKAAYGWHALLPSAYTAEAIKAVQPARGAGGWSSGVYEGTTKSTDTLNVNTAAVIMTAALYAARGEPMLAGGAGDTLKQ